MEKKPSPPDRVAPVDNRPKQKNRFFLWLFLLLLAGAGVWLLYGRKSTADSAPVATKGGRGGAGLGPVPVAAEAAHSGDMPVYLTGLGSVNAFYTVTVRSRVDGQLMSIHFKEGDYVQEGQVLAEIDPRPFQVQLEQAEGQMARDQAILANAKLDLKRYQTLLEQDAIPKQQLDTQVSTLGQAEGAIKQDQSAIDNAKLQLTYSKVTAPISGRIGLRLVDPGNIVHAADTTGLLVITQLQPISVLFTIPEDSLPEVLRKLRAGISLPVQAFNRDNSKSLATGRLLTVDNQIDATTGTSKLKAVFENRDSQLFPNQFVNARVLVDTEHNQVIIPAPAIQRGQQGAFVYVVKPDSSVEVRPITLGITEANEVSVRAGLQAGETVVTDGTDKLQAGSKVRVRGAAGPGGGGQGGGARKRGGGPGGPVKDATGGSGKRGQHGAPGTSSGPPPTAGAGGAPK